MSQMPSLQCLFCQHINPADADDCRRCDGQLNLQPCRRCGAVDLRTATNCYKCGAKFSLPVATRLEFPFPPAIVDRESAYSTSTDIGVARSEAGHLPAGVPDKPDTGAKPERGTPAAVLAILLLLIAGAAAAYFFRGNAAPANMAAETDGASKPVGPVPNPRAPLPEGADAVPAARPLPATDAEVKNGPDPSVVEKCPPAVATLGLCNPEPRQEKR
jgi:ribosomal protein L40E